MFRLYYNGINENVQKAVYDSLYAFLLANSMLNFNFLIGKAEKIGFSPRIF